ncbi:toll/interleukin-1 receptor domain-containing protein [Achromobacter ruhlandii]|uniref:toll/interleukin-1 receptor domain-containing protein n=1 Tax=Achromobacter ruhlandii TaxID=72557 RepID=UPI0009ECF978|nr:toll/interleukin-1 receptor domain-containing protein [Achromobacter ruhlandii]
MALSAGSPSYGPVIVLRGKYKGRIGYYDDDASHRGKSCGIVMFAPPLITPYYYFVPVQYLAVPNTPQLLERFNELLRLLSPYYGDAAEGNDRVSILEEFAYVSTLLNDRMFTAQFEKGAKGAKIFISHSSRDKGFVRGLAVDLSEIGHQPWLDEWEIIAGESIVEKVSSGLEDADLVVVVLSKNSIESKWVENEWQAKYWGEIQDRRVAVIPVVIEDCVVPILLRTKKYVDFREDYTSALELLSKAIAVHYERKLEG